MALAGSVLFPHPANCCSRQGLVKTGLGHRSCLRGGREGSSESSRSAQALPLQKTQASWTRAPAHEVPGMWSGRMG